MNSLYYDLYYESYRTRKFYQIFPNFDIFLNEFKGCKLYDKDNPLITDESAETLYYILYGKFGNSNIVNADENQFKYRLYSIIFQYGPTWEKELEIQKAVRKLKDEDLELGNTQIMNQSFNPSTAPSTSTLEELTTINQQNTIKTKRGKLDQYSFVMDLLKKDVTEAFISKFDKLFKNIVYGENPLWYREEQ